MGIYTVQQLLQLAQEVAGEWTPQNYIWKRMGSFMTRSDRQLNQKDLIHGRGYRFQSHISRVKELFESLDLFIFTLGLTEMWVHKESGTVYPTAPGTLAGEYDENTHEFKNAQFMEIIKTFVNTR